MRATRLNLVRYFVFAIVLCDLSAWRAFSARTAVRDLLATQYDYDPYGRLIRETGPKAASCPFRYSTKYRDPDLELYYYGHRWYDAAAMKWLTPDPIGERGGANLTAFCDGDPINKVDPLGLDLIIPGVTTSSTGGSLHPDLSIPDPVRDILKISGYGEDAPPGLVAALTRQYGPYRDVIWGPSVPTIEELQAARVAARDAAVLAIEAQMAAISDRRNEYFLMVERGTRWFAVTDHIRSLDAESFRLNRMRRAIKYEDRPVLLYFINGGDDPIFVYSTMTLAYSAAKLTVRGAGALRTALTSSADEVARGSSRQLIEFGYHATFPEAAASIKKTGFRPGTRPGRLGSGGVYVNNTPEGALAEFQYHHPAVVPEIITVRYRPGIRAVTDVTPRHYVDRLPLNVDSITAPSLRLPGTKNTIIYDLNSIEVLRP